MIRVAMVGPYPADGATPTGGIEAVALNLVQAMARLPELQVAVVTIVDGLRREAVTRKNGISVWQIPSSRSLGRLTFFSRERRRIAALLDEINPHVVHIQGQNMYAAAAFGARFPTVITLHGLLFKEASIVDPASGIIERYYRRARGLVNARWEAHTLRRAQDIIIISPYVRSSVRDRTRARLHEIPNPIQEEFFTVESAEIPGRVLYCGAIEPRKGLLDLMRSFSVVRASLPGASLHIVGRVVDPGYFQAVRQAIVTHRLSDAVVLCGVIPQGALLREYAAACALALPSQEESSAMVIQQAMAAGKAVAASAVGGIPDLVRDGEDGLLHMFGDTETLAAHLGAILRDEELRRRLGRAARAQAERRFRAAAIAERTIAVYRTLLGGPQGEVARHVRFA